MEEYKLIVEKTVRDLFKSTSIEHIKNYKNLKETEITNLNNEIKFHVLQKYPLLVDNIASVRCISESLKNLDLLKDEISKKLVKYETSDDIISDSGVKTSDLINTWSNTFYDDFHNLISNNNNKNQSSNICNKDKYFCWDEQKECSILQIKAPDNDSKYDKLYLLKVSGLVNSLSTTILNEKLTLPQEIDRLFNIVEEVRISFSIDKFTYTLFGIINLNNNIVLYSDKTKRNLILSELIDCFFKNEFNRDYSNSEITDKFESLLNLDTINQCFLSIFSLITCAKDNQKIFYHSEFYQTLVSDDKINTLFYEIFHEITEMNLEIVTLINNHNYDKYSSHSVNLKNTLVGFIQNIINTVSMQVKLLLIIFHKELVENRFKQMIIIFLQMMLIKEIFSTKSNKVILTNTNKGLDFTNQPFISSLIIYLYSNGLSTISSTFILDELEEENSLIKTILKTICDKFINCLEKYFNYFKTVVNKNSVDLILENNDEKRKNSYEFSLFADILKQSENIINHFNEIYSNEKNDEDRFKVLVYKIGNHINELVADAALLKVESYLKALNMTKSNHIRINYSFTINNNKTEFFNFLSSIIMYINELTKVSSKEDLKLKFWNNILNQIITNLKKLNNQNSPMNDSSYYFEINIHNFLNEIIENLRIISKDEELSEFNSFKNALNENLNIIEGRIIEFEKKKIKKSVEKLSSYLYTENFISSKLNPNMTTISLNEVISEVKKLECFKSNNKYTLDKVSIFVK